MSNFIYITLTHPKGDDPIFGISPNKIVSVERSGEGSVLKAGNFAYSIVESPIQVDHKMNDFYAQAQT